MDYSKPGIEEQVDLVGQMEGYSQVKPPEGGFSRRPKVEL